MDPNASANVQVTQPAPVPAPQSDAANGTNPVSPAGEPAKEGKQTTDPGAGAGKMSFDPEIQKFLDNQNIKTDDPAAAIAELAKRNMEFRGHAKPTQTVQEVLAPKAEPKVTPAEPKPEQPAPSEPVSKSLSDMDIATVSLYIKQNYPNVDANADFYKAMIADGFKPTTADGQINLKAVSSYAAYKQKLAEAEKVIADNQPKANQIPQPNTAPEYAHVDKVQTMDARAAENIVLFSNTEKRYGRPVHPQYDEAVKFLQEQARQGK